GQEPSYCAGSFTREAVARKGRTRAYIRRRPGLPRCRFRNAPKPPSAQREKSGARMRRDRQRSLRLSTSRASSTTVLVARWVRVVSAARRVITWPVITWRVISTGGSSTKGGGADGSTYRHSRTYATVIATTIISTTVNTTAIDAAAIICGRV